MIKPSGQRGKDVAKETKESVAIQQEKDKEHHAKEAKEATERTSNTWETTKQTVADATEKVKEMTGMKK